jgi:hypothetical protein
LIANEKDAGLSWMGRFLPLRVPGWMLTAGLAALLTFGGFAARGFSGNGFRLGSELAWRFTCLVYFTALVAGPLARLIPFEPLRRLCGQRRQLVWGFCASFGVFLASVLVPNMLALPGTDRDGLTAGTTVFVLLGAALTMMIAYTASRQAAVFLGEKARATMLGAGMSYFWLAYALTGLARIVGPHRPDAFYGLSVSLMVIALLLRFADRFAAKIRTRGEPA